jgi:hypothetical protein
VPAACNPGLFWGKKTLMMHSGTIMLSFLPPIPPGLPRREFQPIRKSGCDTESIAYRGPYPAHGLSRQSLDGFINTT